MHPLEHVTVRLEEPSDEPDVQALVVAAFGEPSVAALLADLRRDHCWLGLSFVAEVDGAPGRVAGHLAYSRAWVDAPERLVDVLVLSPVSVHPHFQGRGVGRALIEESFQALQHRPEPVVFVEGDPAYYGTRSFGPAEALGFTRPSVRVPHDAFQARTLPSFDGGFSGALVYPDVFWRHDAVGLREEERQQIERRRAEQSTR
jgi:putative acetyltransferase